MKRFLALFLAIAPLTLFAQDASQCNARQWSSSDHYRSANAQIGNTKGLRIVLMGSTTVEQWDLPKSFAGKDTGPREYVNRGISGQGTAQMLLRFYRDVVELRPRAVILSPGFDDLANDVPLAEIGDNLRAMSQMAKANNIRVLFAANVPTDPNGTNPVAKKVTSEKIRELNRWMYQYAKEHGDTYVDIWSTLGDPKYNLLHEYSADGANVNEAAYKNLAPILDRNVVEAFSKNVGRVSIKGEYKGGDE